MDAQQQDIQQQQQQQLQIFTTKPIN
ncbi:unnamed protein product, partial [Rotaria sordida]